MPQPIHLCDARLAQYLRLFSGKFSLPQWKYFVTVLLGLLHCDERHTLSVLLRQVAVNVTIFGLCFFLRTAPWSVDDLTAVHQAHFYQQVAAMVTEDQARQRAQRERRVGRPKPTVVTDYLILDDSTHLKCMRAPKPVWATTTPAPRKKWSRGTAWSRASMCWKANSCH